MVALPTRDERSFNKTVRQILRVNYAGEYGAIRIYRAQIAVSRVLTPTIVPFLSETILHEYKHADTFRSLMPARATRPCGATPLWGVGGTALGLITGVLGIDAMMVCTEAVERVVHAHLGKQIEWLGGKDAELVSAITLIRDEEEGHREFAHEKRELRTAFLSGLDAFVAAVTAFLIWIATYGDLTRMRSSLREQ
jgi:3-demethoxyubiquinol 3-hydroxylase